MAAVMLLHARKVSGKRMTDSLLIHYRADGSIQAAVLGEPGKLRDTPAPVSFADLAEKYPGAHATLLIDSALLHSARLALPGNNRQRQIKAAPYALEDQLACDIDELHFILGKREADNLITVSCISKSRLRALLTQFSEAGIQIDSACPDLLALPLAAQQWTVLVDSHHACIKISAQSGYYCERANLPVILPALLQQPAMAPQTLLVLTAADDDVTALFAGVDLPRITQNYSQSLLQIFALHLNDARSMNLLQGEFAVKRPASLHWRAWRIAAIAAIGWLALQLVMAGIEIRMLKTVEQQLTADIETEFKRIFPDAQKFSGMQSRVKNRLKQLKGGGDKSQEIFLQILAEAAPALMADGLVIRGIAYRERHVDMELQATSLDILEAARSRLDNQHRIKSVLSTSVEKDKATGRLRLEQVIQDAEDGQG
ncbi:MAG: ral secretion pathway protein [Pseudomonadota bacterium]|nr:ral secretion pathway protein [Pseudomonadota bacterium]